MERHSVRGHTAPGMVGYWVLSTSVDKSFAGWMVGYDLVYSFLEKDNDYNHCPSYYGDLSMGDLMGDLKAAMKLRCQAVTGAKDVFYTSAALLGGLTGYLVYHGSQAKKR